MKFCIIKLLIISIIALIMGCGGGSSDSNTVASSNLSSELVSSAPAIEQWQNNMLTFGRIHCDSLKNSAQSYDTRLGATYYDAIWVYHQIKNFTGDSYWNSCVSSARSLYRDNFVIGGNGQVPGYWLFSHGLRIDIETEGSAESQRAIDLLIENAAYASVLTPLEWTVDQELSREVAYNIMNFLNARRVGLSYPEGRLNDFVNQALGHIEQWNSGRSTYMRPFMVALTAQALIEYYEETGDQRIPAAVRTVMNNVWNRTWLADQQTFKYTDREHASGGTEPAPDLNLLIAPAYMWLALVTGEPDYQLKADQIFAGGVQAAFLGNAKQFNQNYRWSFQYLIWRNAYTSG